jgi:predicted nucleic acid-binding protein
MILVDTNVLLRMAQPAHPMHAQAMSAVDALSSGGETLCVVPQVVYEYWAVATRPEQVNGLGMSAVAANADVAKIVQRFRLVRDEQGIFDVWHRLVAQHQVLGKNAHDARLVAAMVFHGITDILTFNVGDFQRYPGLRIINPATYAAP